MAYDQDGGKVAATAAAGARSATGLPDLVDRLQRPRAVWLMVPAAAVDAVIATLVPLLSPGDTLLDGGKSYYHDDFRRAGEPEPMPRDGGSSASVLAAHVGAGIDLEALAARLQTEGAEGFVKSWRELLGAIDAKSKVMA